MADIGDYSDERLHEVGRYLAGVREQHGLSQKEAATRAGMTASAYLSLIEGGRRAVSQKTLEKLAQAYKDVPLQEMIEHIGLSKKGKLLPESPTRHRHIPDEPAGSYLLSTESDRTGVEKLAGVENESVRSHQDADVLLRLLDAAVAFIRLDPMCEAPAFPAETAREKVRDLEDYQKRTGRLLLTMDELRRIFESSGVASA